MRREMLRASDLRPGHVLATMARPVVLDVHHGYDVSTDRDVVSVAWSSTPGCHDYAPDARVFVCLG